MSTGYRRMKRWYKAVAVLVEGGGALVEYWWKASRKRVEGWWSVVGELVEDEGCVVIILVSSGWMGS